MGDRSSGDTEHELARTMATVHYRHSKGTEELATGRVRDADYHLFQAFTALGEYLIDAEEWYVDTGTGREVSEC